MSSVASMYGLSFARAILERRQYEYEEERCGDSLFEADLK